MPLSNLTGTRIQSAPIKKFQYVIRDKRTKGFGLKVKPTGQKCFIINFMKGGVRYSETIGDAATMSLRVARSLAKARILKIKDMHDIGPETAFEVMAEITMITYARIWKPYTLKVCRKYLNISILPYFRGKAIGDITRRDIKEWFASLKDSPASANRSKSVISVIMREAEERGARPEASNPVLGIKRYKRPLIERVLTPDEMARVGAALLRREKRHPVHVAFIRLLILTGCRQGELHNLLWADYRDGKLFLRDSKTGPRIIFLSSHAQAVLDGLKTKKSKKVFPASIARGDSIEVYTFWDALRKEIGIEDVRLHDLRHNYASVAIRNKISLPVIGTLLGHKKPDTSLRYAHLNDDLMREAVQLMNSHQQLK
jgi:integrase